MRSIEFTKVKLRDGFWKTKQEMIRHTTAKAVYDRFDETHRFSSMACTWKEGDPDMPHIFWDSDVAKWVEGVAYLLAAEPDAELEGLAEAAIRDILANIREDGYFNCHFLVTELDQRFANRGNHELYCAGHLIESAVAWYISTGKRDFLNGMCRFADHIEKVFKIQQSAQFVTPGHPEIELALMRLYQVTGEKRYLELASFFIDQHGNNDKEGKQVYPWALPPYNMDEMPLRDRETADGHCVRTLYLLCGMADVAEETNDEALKAACRRCFDNIVNKRMYITGSVGSTHLGEAFTIDYDLPNRTAYTETCAAISLAMFSHRMLHLETDSVFADTLERAIYNGVLSGVSMDGKAFFYENPLEIDPAFNEVNPATEQKDRYPITKRVEVFECSCCPPNIMRVVASVGGWIYGEDADAVYVNQYIPSDAEFNGTRIALDTAYPADGRVTVNCTSDKPFLALRIPGWCKSFTLDQPYELKNGYAYISMTGTCQVTLTMEMPVVLIAANRRVHENAGRVAVTRGPVVYCAEGVDNGTDLKSISLKTDARFALAEPRFLLPDLTVTAYRPKEQEALYYPAGEDEEAFELRLIPYYAFANRGTSEMLVWLLKK